MASSKLTSSLSLFNSEPAPMMFKRLFRSEPASMALSMLTSSMSLVDSEPASMASSKLTSSMSLVDSEPASMALSKIDLFDEPVQSVSLLQWRCQRLTSSMSLFDQ